MESERPSEPIAQHEVGSVNLPECNDHKQMHTVKRYEVDFYQVAEI
jgi:hypothetical protein